ncbi:hypothetical protein F544_1140 [Bibersteinia trehalosi USDA-ARS-USMARC-190]|uniref:Uncharacterized protein n=1 Tax=Bibersteinia trehalosi USDA-ARS-USMARC-190 TaxID=1263832 RepID=W0R2I8_BIBTR|nr:hypothetical protein F544_1140 [Bibersteinia trehalosi USDA-ARS-USMARC-190]
MQKNSGNRPLAHTSGKNKKAKEKFLWLWRKLTNYITTPYLKA